MIDFSGLLARTNLNSLEAFLRFGVEDLQGTPEATYAQRLAEAEKNAQRFFKARYTDLREYDEIMGYFVEQAAVYEEVYFEIGLILGAKIAFQFRGKLEELS